MENSLRGAVMTKFHDIASFSRSIGWDRKKASRIINLKQRPSVNDIENMANLLDIRDPKSFMQIFFPSIPTM